MSHPLFGSPRWCVFEQVVTSNSSYRGTARSRETSISLPWSSLCDWMLQSRGDLHVHTTYSPRQLRMTAGQKSPTSPLAPRCCFSDTQTTGTHECMTARTSPISPPTPPTTHTALFCIVLSRPSTPASCPLPALSPTPSSVWSWYVLMYILHHTPSHTACLWSHKSEDPWVPVSVPDTRWVGDSSPRVHPHRYKWISFFSKIRQTGIWTAVYLSGFSVNSNDWL